jgi:hypothetical protein
MYTRVLIYIYLYVYKEKNYNNFVKCQIPQIDVKQKKREKIGSPSPGQGCQIFLTTTYQSGIKYTKSHKIYQMATKYTKWQYNRPNGHKMYKHLSIVRPTKVYPNWGCWFENMPSGNPAYTHSEANLHFYFKYA